MDACGGMAQNLIKSSRGRLHSMVDAALERNN
ncbi:hypothetical protein EDD80_10167 [Anseongella ginsenosidimutans]|uniref:Uncharacterized protein n=1 Tax=Anseongella ginsenosidimutans TaxID=496056 RepID=A0A4R3KZ27_9SPHI|nr:hypothetical protein EDD80_10167 [Anseongella ginsenosidimutans]